MNKDFNFVTDNLLNADFQKNANIKLLPSIEGKISDIPKTRYYGSKRKLLTWLYDTVKGFEFDTVLDVFGGTASVSRLFQEMRKDCLLYTSPSPRDATLSRMPSSA